MFQEFHSSILQEKRSNWRNFSSFERLIDDGQRISVEFFLLAPRCESEFKRSNWNVISVERQRRSTTKGRFLWWNWFESVKIRRELSRDRSNFYPLVLFVLMRIKASESLTDYMLRLKKSKNLPLKLHLQVRKFIFIFPRSIDFLWFKCLEELERNKLHVDLIKQNPEERERIAYSHIYQRFLSALVSWRYSNIHRSTLFIPFWKSSSDGRSFWNLELILSTSSNLGFLRWDSIRSSNRSHVNWGISKFFEKNNPSKQMMKRENAFVISGLLLITEWSY